MNHDKQPNSYDLKYVQPPLEPLGQMPSALSKEKGGECFRSKKNYESIA